MLHRVTFLPFLEYIYDWISLINFSFLLQQLNIGNVFYFNTKIRYMQTLAKLIHKTYASYLPTAFPAHYYGMPNGKILLVFSRFYEVDFGDSGLEFVIAEHQDFVYDYEKEQVIPKLRSWNTTPVFAEQVDYPRAKIDIIDINREMQSYGQALVYLNNEAKKMQQIA